MTAPVAIVNTTEGPAILDAPDRVAFSDGFIRNLDPRCAVLDGALLTLLDEVTYELTGWDGHAHVAQRVT